MKMFRDVIIGEEYVVEGGHCLVKISNDSAIFPDALNVGLVSQPESLVTYGREEFEALPKFESVVWEFNK